MQFSKWNNVTEYLVENIKNRIMKGEFPVDAKLPSEKVLCETYKVGRSSVREALSMLEAVGMIRIERGRGSFVESAQENAARAKNWYAGKTASLAELINIRAYMECLAVEKAALTISAAQLVAMEKINADFLAGADPYDYWQLLNCDMHFHQMIFEVADIGLLSQINGLVEAAYAEYRTKAYILTKHIDTAGKGHEEVIVALKAHDAPRAREALDRHIRQSLEHINQVLHLNQ